MWQNGSLADLSGNGNTATLTSAGGYPSVAATGLPIGGYTYNNSDAAYADAGTGVSLNPASITVEAWVNFSSFSSSDGYVAVVSKDTSGNPVNQLLVKSTGKLAVFVYGSSAYVDYDGSGTYTLSLNAWHFVAFSYSSAAGLVGYIDGQVDYATEAANGALASNSGNTQIGNDQINAGRNPTATIGAVYIYNAAKSQSAIQYDQTVTCP
jgi:hypothetical protein